MTQLKPNILHFQSLPSTNNEAAHRATLGAEEGLVIVADEQTAGRGRLQRTWVSPKGAGLYFSIVLRPQITQDRWPLLTLMASLAVSDALLETYNLLTDIKWPNDLLAGERKICGILAEVVDTQMGRAVVLGVGINLTQAAFPPELSESATSVSEATGQLVERDAVLQPLVDALSYWYGVLHEPEGGAKILAIWINRSSYAEGKRVSIVNGSENVTGITRGLESDGALRIETETGKVVAVRAGDVSNVRAKVSDTV